MTYEFYKIIHILGLTLLALSLGGLAHHAMNGGLKATNPNRRSAVIFHGLGLFLLLLGGFGMLARQGIHSLPGWVIGKLVIWLALGAALAFVYKSTSLAKKIWWGIPVLVTAAVILCLYKPF